MEKRTDVWNTYHQITAESAPRKLLKEALDYVTERNAALDLGCGSMRDSKLLLEVGFESVEAVDVELSLDIETNTTEDARLSFYAMSFEEFSFYSNKYDLINAQYSLPFIAKESLRALIPRIIESIKIGGVFTGQFFGLHDSWSQNSSMAFFNIEEIETIFADLEILRLTESEYDGETALNQSKHWHIFDFIVRKVDKCGQ